MIDSLLLLFLTLGSICAVCVALVIASTQFTKLRIRVYDSGKCTEHFAKINNEIITAKVDKKEYRWKLRDNNNEYIKPYYMHRFFWTFPAYDVDINSVAPLYIDRNSNSFKFIDARTLGESLNQHLLQDLLTIGEKLNINQKMLLYMGLALALVVVVYFVFVAPDMMPVSACPNITARTVSA
jgi:hypothetical protein